MPISIVVGGQYGSEAKGKIVSHLAMTRNAEAAVRCGGPNAGHTVDVGGKKHVTRCLPSGFANPNTKLYLCAGSLVDLKLLNEEVRTLQGLGYGDITRRIEIDSHAVMLLNSEHGDAEVKDGFGDRFGSTQTGTGTGTIARIMRDPARCLLAKDVSWIQSHVVPSVSAELNRILDGVGTEEVGRVILEGTQGFGLSLYHGPWPYCTSRDTTAGNYLSEAGVSPMLVDEVVMVIRTWPIRVGGNSGPLNCEVTWDVVADECGAKAKGIELGEFTSVTKRLRRVGRFDINMVKQAAMANRPTALAIHGMDYLNWDDRLVNRYEELSKRSKAFCHWIEAELQVPVRYIMTGPRNEDMIVRDNRSLLNIPGPEDAEFYRHQLKLKGYGMLQLDSNSRPVPVAKEE